MGKRTITLTDRPPVVIEEDNWPVIASAKDSEHDGQVECQANRKSKWGLYVRQHADGRTLVYAIYDYCTNWSNSRDISIRQGVMLNSWALREAKDDAAAIVAAIKDLGDDMMLCERHEGDEARWGTLVDQCIADLPAEELA
jgi:hypothetical protein